jgi:phage terminase large subunit
VTRVSIPYQPRPLQREVGKLARSHRFGVIVCHRRFGKTVLGVNLNQQSALICPLQRPRAAYIGPTYTQAKGNAWDYMQYYAQPIPGVRVHQSELRIDYPNGGQSRIFGADNPDSLRGFYFDRVVLDEFGLHPPKTFSEVIGPTLVDRGGSALILGTPAGKNQFYDMAQTARAAVAAGDPNWFYAEYKASDTGLLDEAYLAQARGMMTTDEYDQEFECSFEASVKGAFYATEMEAARVEQRITAVPYDAALPVDTDWDLGMDDQMAIWFSQSLRSGEVRLIDYYANSGEGFPHYVKLLREKPYVYGKHYPPHDIAVRELGTGKSRKDVAASLGLVFQDPDQPLEIADGIDAVRRLLPRCWFDAVKCKDGIEALKHYRKDYNTRLNEFKAAPVHDWASHGADAFRGLAVRHKAPEPAKPKPHGVRRHGGSESALSWLKR